jgi:hypothetical protein
MIKKILQLLTNDWNQAIKDMEAIERVRELAERFNKEDLVSPFPAMAQEILKALDGEQE